MQDIEKTVGGNQRFLIGRGVNDFRARRRQFHGGRFAAANGVILAPRRTDVVWNSVAEFGREIERGVIIAQRHFTPRVLARVGTCRRNGSRRFKLES